MLKRTILILILFFIFSISAFSFGQAEYEHLNFNGFISDNADVISSERENALNRVLLELQAKTGVDLAIVTLNSLNERPIEDVSLTIARKYGLGDGKLNNGALILVAPNDRKARIETGYGLEPYITDAKAGRVLDDYMIPYFKKGAYQTGITEGALALACDIAKAYNVSLSLDRPQMPEKDDEEFWIVFIFVLIFIMLTHDKFRGSGGGFGGGFGGGSGGGSLGIRFGGGGGFGGGGASRGW